MLGILGDEFISLVKDLRPSAHILNESEALGKVEMIADSIEISKHDRRIRGENIWPHR